MVWIRAGHSPMPVTASPVSSADRGNTPLPRLRLLWGGVDGRRVIRPTGIRPRLRVSDPLDRNFYRSSTEPPTNRRGPPKSRPDRVSLARSGRNEDAAPDQLRVRLRTPRLRFASVTPRALPGRSYATGTDNRPIGIPIACRLRRLTAGVRTAKVWGRLPDHAGIDHPRGEDLRTRCRWAQ